VSKVPPFDSKLPPFDSKLTSLNDIHCAQEPNAKYLALETLARLALIPEILEAIRVHQPTITASLKVRQGATPLPLPPA